MNIGIDARLLHNSTGIGRYTRSLFFELQQHARQDDVPERQNDVYYLLYDRPFPDLPDPPFEAAFPGASGLPPQVNVLTAPCTRRILWTNLYVPRLLRDYQIDIYHGVCNFELPLRKVCRYVVTIHDLVPLFFPRLVPWKHRLFFRLFMKPVARTADIIITDSEHSKHDIVRYLKVPEEKIRVIYLGYTPRQAQEQLSVPKSRDVLKKYGIARPYLLFVGILEPKKNLARLLDAFALLRHMPATDDRMQLVIAGDKGWAYEHLNQYAKNLHIEQHVVFTGYVSEEELAALYKGAEVFVFPSIYEGFGLPVIEAMTYGVPVVTSQRSSLPEIAGEAGILVDPEKPEAIRDGIAAVLVNTEKAAAMREKGQQQARKFSWRRTAERTYQAYQDAYFL